LNFHVFCNFTNKQFLGTSPVKGKGSEVNPAVFYLRLSISNPFVLIIHNSGN